jgi:hypothetical protein
MRSLRELLLLAVCEGYCALHRKFVDRIVTLSILMGRAGQASASAEERAARVDASLFNTTSDKSNKPGTILSISAVLFIVISPIN